MNVLSDSPEIAFHVSPFINLYYSLEVSTGTVMEVYVEEYAKQMKKVFPKNVLEKIKNTKNIFDARLIKL